MIYIIYEVSVASFCLATEVSQNHDNVIMFNMKNTTKEGWELPQKCHKNMTMSWNN